MEGEKGREGGEKWQADEEGDEEGVITSIKWKGSYRWEDKGPGDRDGVKLIKDGKR